MVLAPIAEREQHRVFQGAKLQNKNAVCKFFPRICVKSSNSAFILTIGVPYLRKT